MKANVKLDDAESSRVTRQMSPNPDLPTPTSSAFRSVADFITTYERTDKTIADLTAEFVVPAAQAKQKQDDILPHLAVMQSLLSKKGANHNLVIEARKKGTKIPWWSAYYSQYKERLWESLRTMERRIAQYRKDPSVGTRRGKGPKPKHLTQLEHKLLETATCNREVIVDLRAGRTEEAIVKLDKNTPTQDRIDEYLARGVKPTHDNPDGDAKQGSDRSDPIPTTAADVLKRELASEPDIDVASKKLTDYLQTKANEFGNERIQVQLVSARVKFAGRDHRIMPGDWLEKRAKDLPPTLSKCVGIADFMARRRVQDWGDNRWAKEHVVFTDHERHYQVITEDVARRLAPGAFDTRGL